jgi:hypothetical protein
MKYLVEFCDLMIKEPMDIKWSANMIIRPEMNKDVIRKMKDSGCKHIIFGIESTGTVTAKDSLKEALSYPSCTNIFLPLIKIF